MACKLNIKADNGNNSILFKELASVVTDPNEAIDIYFYTKTKEFKDAYVKSHDQQTDLNGEPTYASLSDYPPILDKEYVKLEQDATAKVYKNLVDAVPRIEQIINNRIKYLERSSNKQNKAEIGKLNRTKEMLARKTINESVPKFLSMANEHLQGLKKAAVKEYNSPDNSIKNLATLNKIAQGYNVIKQLNTASYK